jgi:hypothetical protein
VRVLREEPPDIFLNHCSLGCHGFDRRKILNGRSFGDDFSQLSFPPRARLRIVKISVDLPREKGEDAPEKDPGRYLHCHRSLGWLSGGRRRSNLFRRRQTNKGDAQSDAGLPHDV